MVMRRVLGTGLAGSPGGDTLDERRRLPEGLLLGHSGGSPPLHEAADEVAGQRGILALTGVGNVAGEAEEEGPRPRGEGATTRRAESGGNLLQEIRAALRRGCAFRHP